MKSKKTLYSIGIGLLLLAAFYWYKNSPTDGSKEQTREDSKTALTEASSSQEITQKSLDGRYTNPNYASSFIPPAGLSVASFSDVDSMGAAVTTVILQPKDPSVAHVNNQMNNKGVQILISSWDEAPDTLTASRIQQDIPKMKISNLKVNDIKNIGTVLEFDSDNVSFAGKSHEAWFVAHNDLYQISTYKGNASAINAIISTWNFQ